MADGIRRGLPRVSGGDAWPPFEGAATPDVAAPNPGTQAPAGSPLAPSPAASTPAPPPARAARAPRRGLPRPNQADPSPGQDAWPTAVANPATSSNITTGPATSVDGGAGTETEPRPARAGRRAGLPRKTTTGNDVGGLTGAASPTTPVADDAPAPSGRRGLPRAKAGAVVGDAAASTAVAVARPPLPFQRTVFPGVAASTPREPAGAAEPATTLLGKVRQAPLPWIVGGLFGAAALLLLAASTVMFVRWFLSLGFMQDFLATYPGEYHLPEGAPVGIPAWMAWQHFFNFFLMVLIIRSGLQVRRETRPSAFWSPKWNPQRKISLPLWFHQSLDILWLANGLVFVVLLLATGQWMRLVPTSWEVFPNALSAALQYVSLDWPTENGWVNYNSLQQLAYFVTVFVAGPLAVITGVRMSGIWPKNAVALSKAYPIEWARAIHFPVMLYFVTFIIFHVALVFATGALRNLNHMYAAQGSTDPVAYADNWAGFWIFMVSLVVVAAAWIAARPLVLAPIARIFGKVSAR